MIKKNMMAINMPFKEKRVDNEGNPVFDKKTGEQKYDIIYRKVSHNPGYYPKKN